MWCGLTGTFSSCFVLISYTTNTHTDLEYYTCNEQTGELKPLTNPAWFKE